MKISPTSDSTHVTEATRPGIRMVLAMFAILGGIFAIMYWA